MNGMQYKVFWLGHPASEATWEPESSLLDDAPMEVEEYNAKNRRALLSTL